MDGSTKAAKAESTGRVAGQRFDVQVGRWNWTEEELPLVRAAELEGVQFIPNRPPDDVQTLIVWTDMHGNQIQDPDLIERLSRQMEADQHGGES